MPSPNETIQMNREKRDAFMEGIDTSIVTKKWPTFESQENIPLVELDVVKLISEINSVGIEAAMPYVVVGYYPRGREETPIPVELLKVEIKAIGGTQQLRVNREEIQLVECGSRSKRTPTFVIRNASLFPDINIEERLRAVGHPEFIPHIRQLFRIIEKN